MSDQLAVIRSEIAYIEDLWLNDMTGRLRLTSFAFPTPESNAGDRDSFKAQVTADAGFYIDAPIMGRVTNKPTFLVARRMSDAQGRFRGAAFATVSLGYFDDFWRRLTLSPE